jgi:hypothetical protein
MLPAPSYRVAVAVPVLETQKGEVAEKATPQGLTRLGSVLLARPGTSDTRLYVLYASAKSVVGAQTRANVHATFTRG